MTLRRTLPRLGTLGIIAAFLVLSAALRLTAGANAMVAQAADKPFSLREAENIKSEKSEDAVDVVPETLLESLKQQKARLDKREDAVRLREKSLEVAKSELDENLAALADAEERLRETIALARGAAEADIDGLTQVYSKMRPKDAALLFGQMDAQFAAGFLARMKPAIAAEIMGGMEPDRAYAISAILASRNSEVPKDREKVSD